MMMRKIWLVLLVWIANCWCPVISRKLASTTSPSTSPKPSKNDDLASSSSNGKQQSEEEGESSSSSSFLQKLMSGTKNEESGGETKKKAPAWNDSRKPKESPDADAADANAVAAGGDDIRYAKRSDQQPPKQRVDRQTRTSSISESKKRQGKQRNEKVLRNENNKEREENKDDGGDDITYQQQTTTPEEIATQKRLREERTLEQKKAREEKRQVIEEQKAATEKEQMARKLKEQERKLEQLQAKEEKRKLVEAAKSQKAAERKKSLAKKAIKVVKKNASNKQSQKQKMALEEKKQQLVLEQEKPDNILEKKWMSWKMKKEARKEEQAERKLQQQQQKDSKDKKQVQEEKGNASTKTKSDTPKTAEEMETTSATEKAAVNSTSSVESSSASKPANNETATTSSRPTFVVMGASPPPGGRYRGPPPGAMYNRGPPPSPHQQQMMQPNPALAATAIVASLAGVVARLGIVVWITKHLAAEEETLSPVQHFIWECLNERYSKDDAILSRALSKPPDGISQRQWDKYVKSTRKTTTQRVKRQLPSKTVVVVDITPNNQLDITYLSDVVSFLIGAHRKNLLGANPEVVLLLRSGGGEVTAYGLAASQVARLQQLGLHVTVCIDNVAASGGYMMASQASQIVAAPFAVVGSIGVMSEGLNFNKVLNDYGIKPFSIKAGVMKNTLSSLGPITDNDLRKETERMEVIHQAFIELCLARRPSIDISVCDGSVVIGSKALESGLVDRILTSEEYIWEKLCDGDYVLKLHKSTKDQSRIFARALDILPHLRQRMSSKFLATNMAQIVQGAAFVEVVQRAIRRHFE